MAIGVSGQEETRIDDGGKFAQPQNGWNKVPLSPEEEPADPNRDGGISMEFVPPDGGYGWVIVLATTLMNICLLPLVQCFGLIFEKEFKSQGVTAAETSFLLHLHSAIYCSLGLLGSPLLKKFDFRRVAFMGASLMSLGIFLSSFAQSYLVLIFTVSVMIGVGQGIFLPATYLATNSYFKQRLTLAVSFSVTGASISSIFMPQVCNMLLGSLGRTGTVLILAAMSVLAVLCCFLLRPISRHTLPGKSNKKGSSLGRGQIAPLHEDPVEEEMLPARGEDARSNTKEKDEEKGAAHYNGTSVRVYQETTLPRRTRTPWAKIHDLFNLELLKETPYVIAVIGMSVSFASELNIVLMIQFILPELVEFDSSDVALALSLQSIADILGRLLVPLGGHFLKAPPRVMYCGSLVVSTISRTIMAACYSQRGVIFFCVLLLGLAKGTKAVYQSVIIPRYVTLEKLPAANGLNMLLTGALSLLIGPLIGVIHDRSGSYVYALHAGSIMSMSCVVLWILYYFMYERKRLLVINEDVPSSR